MAGRLLNGRRAIVTFVYFVEREMSVKGSLASAVFTLAAVFIVGSGTASANMCDLTQVVGTTCGPDIGDGWGAVGSNTKDFAMGGVFLTNIWQPAGTGNRRNPCSRSI